MDSRTLGRTARSVSVISLGTWQLGGDWGTVTEADARAVLDASVASGVTMFDTADVYSQGASEEILGKAIAGRRPISTSATAPSRPSSTFQATNARRLYPYKARFSL